MTARPGKQPVPRLLLTPREAATALSISERTLWAISKKGRLNRVKIDRAVRYSIRDLETFIEAAKEGAGDNLT